MDALKMLHDRSNEDRIVSKYTEELNKKIKTQASRDGTTSSSRPGGAVQPSNEGAQETHLVMQSMSSNATVTS